MKKLTLADNLSLPLDFVTERIAFLARTGAGKSGGMRVLFEQIVLAKQFGIFIDPKGDAYGIRASGVGNGLPVLVLGGDHGDVPLEATAGKFIAEFLVSERVPTVLDVSDFGKADMIRFVTDLATTLYRRNRDVCHVFIDEADMVAGEKFYDPHCLEAIQLIQNKGRHRGFGVTVATQRSAMINKSVLFASGTLIAMQTTSPKDIKTVREWLEVNSTAEEAKLIVGQLPQLKTREAIVYSPQHLPAAICIEFNSFQTFDSMRTPKPGEARQTPKSVADIDLSAIQRDMAATIEKVKASDPKALQAKVRELEKKLEAKQAAPAESETVEVPVLDEEGLKMLEMALADFYSQQADERQRIYDAIKEALEGFGTSPPTGPLYDALLKIRNATPQLPKKPMGLTPHVQNAIDGRGNFAGAPAAVKKSVGDFMKSGPSAAGRLRESIGDRNGAKIGKAEMAVLKALYWTKDDRSVDMRKIAFFAGYSPNASTISVALSQLRRAGWVDGRTLTDEGLAAMPSHIEPKPTGMDLREFVRGKVGKAENEVLDVLVSAPGQAFTMAQLAERTGYSPQASTLSVALSKLRKFEAVEGGGRDGVRAADVFFE